MCQVLLNNRALAMWKGVATLQSNFVNFPEPFTFSWQEH